MVKRSNVPGNLRSDHTSGETVYLVIVFIESPAFCNMKGYRLGHMGRFNVKIEVNS